ncbi:MAG: NADPH:quinone oxidoreductase family protein [Myxococcota bacterium]
MEPGTRVLVDRYGENPMDAVEHHVRLEAQSAPTSLEPTDVLIRVRAAQVNWVDLLMMSGQYQHMPDPPYCPGMEFAGDVVATGSDASIEVGARVIADGFRTGPRSKGEHRKWGGFATYAIAPSNAVFPLPEDYSYAEGASFYGGFETAYHCLVHRGQLQAGETVLIHGASGTTGLAAVKLAKRIGATVIATGRSADKLEAVKTHGADHGIVTTDSNGVRRFRDEVKALTDGKGVDVVYDPVGGDISLESLRCVRFGARFLIVGWSATPNVAKGRGGRGAPNVNQLPTNLIMMKSLDVRGCPAVISVHRNPALRTERLEAIHRWANAGEIRPVVGRSFPLVEIKDAMRCKWRSEVVGTVVVTP